VIPIPHKFRLPFPLFTAGSHCAEKTFNCAFVAVDFHSSIYPLSGIESLISRWRGLFNVFLESAEKIEYSLNFISSLERTLENNLFQVIDSIPIRLGLQVVWFLMALIVAQMVRREYRRSGGLFLKYIAVAFLLFLLQATSKLGFFTYGMLTGTEVKEALMPMIDHLLKVSSYLFLTFSFTFACGTPKREITVFRASLAALAISAPTFWYFWLQYLAAAPVSEWKFSFFWGDIVYETWNLGILCWGAWYVQTSEVRMRRSFVFSFAILILMVFIHLVNILLTKNTYAPVVVVERLLMIPYFYVIIMAIHREIIDEVKKVVAEKEQLNEQMYRSTIQALAGSLELKDTYTQGHAGRVTEYSLVVGQKLGLSEGDLKALYFAAILHDVGKIGTDDTILNKPAALTEEEFAVVRRHPRDGAVILDGIEALRHIAPYVVSHHERWDGLGYPEGLRGDEIPLTSRIIAVADTFDAMTSDRAYRKAVPLPDVIHELVKEKGKQFDSTVVDAFLDTLSKSDWLQADSQICERHREDRKIQNASTPLQASLKPHEGSGVHDIFSAGC